MGFMGTKASGILQKLGSNKLVARMVAKGISKEDFLADLGEAWAPAISKNSDVEDELKKAVDRIKKSGYEDVFKSTKITEDDLRKLIIDVKESKTTPVKVEATPGRNDPCTCGSGKKYKHCCGQ